MATPSNVPVRPRKSTMATEQYVRKGKSPASTPMRRKTTTTTYKKAPASTRYTPKRVAPARAPPPVLAMRISDCAARYLATVCNPFEAEPGGCVPCDLFPLPSQKFRAFTRGSFTLGTTGFGFIQANPCAANDAATCTFSTSTTVMAIGTTFAAATNLGSAQMTQLPYTTAQLTSAGSVQARIVGFGVRVRYASTEGGRSGTIVAYEDQDHASTAQLTFLTTQQTPCATITRPSGDGGWDSTVCMSGPVTPGELEFQSLVYPSMATSSTQIVANAPLVIAIQGVAGDQYNFEVFEHLEYIGTAVGAKTPSHADTDQYGKGIQALKEVSAVVPVTPEEAPGIAQRFVNKVSEALPQVLAAGSALARGVMGDATGYLQLMGMASDVVFGNRTMGGAANMRPTTGRVEYNRGRRMPPRITN